MGLGGLLWGGCWGVADRIDRGYNGDMPRRYSSRELTKIVESQGWRFSRQRGSHMIFVKPGERNHVLVPASERQIKPGTLSNIKKQARLSNDEFDRIADEVL